MPERKLVVFTLLTFCLLSLIQPVSAPGKFSIRVVSLYESIIDTETSTLTRLLQETHTDLVFRAYFRGFHRNLNATDYSKLVEQIRHIKTRLPNIQVMGGISCSVVEYPGDYWPNGTLITEIEARQMLWTLPNGSLAHHPSFPWPVLDISTPLARQFIEAYAFRFIDAGVDSLFFDEIDIIPRTASRYGLTISEQIYVEAWREIVVAVKAYALNKYDKVLQVTLNTGYVNTIGEPPPEIWPYQDFISVSFNPKTMKTESDQEDWAGFKAQVTSTYANLPPIMAFIDWGAGETPMSIFAALSRDQQIRMLKLLHDTAAREGLLLVYPLRGGVINGSITYIDYNNTYDAVKQGTLDTIVQLSGTISNPTQMSTTSAPPFTPGFAPITVSASIVGAFATTILIGLVVFTLKRKRRHANPTSEPA